MRGSVRERGAASVLPAGFLAGCSSERVCGAYDPFRYTWKTSSGLKVENPVSGTLLFPRDALKVDYMGDICYFENEFDREMFLRDPGVYDYRGSHPNYGGND